MSPALVVAANRLPVARDADGEWQASPGGLVRALLPIVRESGGAWVGWAGDADTTESTIDAGGVDLHPIPISAAEIAGYYEGLANDTLWPLYHDAIRDSAFDADDWQSYVDVNERFAARIAEVAPPGAFVWLHDYHLQLVPSSLRDRRPDVRIGWFDHIPFPPVELFQRLPWRGEILRGLLGADVLGFQRAQDARNFVAAAQQIAGAEGRGDDRLGFDGRTVVAREYPISIDVEEFEEIASGRLTRRRTSQFRTRLGDPEVILLGVDRLDYTKGIGNRLRAFGNLLDDGRLDPGRVVFVQVATPTREGVASYREERRTVEELVGRINGAHARLGYPVVHYLYRMLPLDELVPLYRAGDVMLVTPLRDGMNLVAKEYVAVHTDGDGVLVLSEFTGAADELRAALLVNPHDERSMEDTVLRAIEMHRHERRERMAALRESVRGASVADWAHSFLDTLGDVGARRDAT